MTTCAECGHDHFINRFDGYGECPIQGCDCTGQEWARQNTEAAVELTPADRDEFGHGLGDIDAGDDELDYGGAYDGIGTVTSDADPGL